MLDKFLVKIIGRIYDCAIDPTEWADTLADIRDRLDMAYLSVHFMTFPPAYPRVQQEHFVVATEWDDDWMQALPPLVRTIPHFNRMRDAPLDEPITQLRVMPETDFRRTDFYRQWAKPQGLRDNCNVALIRRDRVTGMMSGATYDRRPLFSDEDLALLQYLAPHLRRALLISDLLDESRQKVQVYRALLDKITLAVFLVGPQGEVAYHNAAAEQMLGQTTALAWRNRRLTGRSAAHAGEFAQVINRACSGSDLDIGLWGNGMALPGSDGDMAVAYVLPLGQSERRRALGPGLAAVFVTSGANARPPAVEILTAFSGLTTAEARIALSVAEGLPVATIGQDLGIATNTVRKHLANIFDKTGLRSQASLSAFVNRLRIPLIPPEAS